MHGLDSYYYATFDEYGGIIPTTIRATEKDGVKAYEARVRAYKNYSKSKSDGGLCFGKFISHEWRTVDNHKGVEYLRGFRAEQGGQ
jgi:hypothetical protein